MFSSKIEVLEELLSLHLVFQDATSALYSAGKFVLLRCNMDEVAMTSFTILV
jgi:hypothetical protein